MRAQEHQHNTPGQVQEYVSAALALVETLDPPDDLRVAVFTKAAELYAGKQVFVEPPTSLARVLGG